MNSGRSSGSASSQMAFVAAAHRLRLLPRPRVCPSSSLPPVASWASYGFCSSFPAPSSSPGYDGRPPTSSGAWSSCTACGNSRAASTLGFVSPASRPSSTLAFFFPSLAETPSSPEQLSTTKAHARVEHPGTPPEKARTRRPRRRRISWRSASSPCRDPCSRNRRRGPGTR